jgi:hypothetical protein
MEGFTKCDNRSLQYIGREIEKFSLIKYAIDWK